MALTKKAIARAVTGKVLKDSQVIGLEIYKGKNVQTWRVYYKTRDTKRERRKKIGYYPTIDIEQARMLAREVLVEVARGNDPSEVEKDITVHKLFEKFIDDMASQLKPKTLAGYEQCYQQYLREFSGHPIRQLRKSEVARMHTAAPLYAGNRALALLSRLYTYAHSAGLVSADTNPAKGVRRNTERPRTRYAGVGELARIGEGIREWGHSEHKRKRQFSDLLSLLILTGARLSEIHSSKNEYYDFGARLIRLPDSKTGAKNIYLPDDAVPIVRRNYSHTQTYLFQHASLIEPFKGVQKLWGQFKNECHIKDLRMHDLRRSYATYAKSKGMSMDNIRDLLGHSTVKTTEKSYAFLMKDAKAEVGQAVSEEMMSKLSGQVAGS